MRHGPQDHAAFRAAISPRDQSKFGRHAAEGDRQKPSSPTRCGRRSPGRSATRCPPRRCATRTAPLARMPGLDGRARERDPQLRRHYVDGAQSRGLAPLIFGRKPQQQPARQGRLQQHLSARRAETVGNIAVFDNREIHTLPSGDMPPAGNGPPNGTFAAASNVRSPAHSAAARRSLR